MIRALSFLAALLLSAPAFAQPPDTGSIYVATPILQTAKDSLNDDVYALPEIDGIAIRIPWRMIQPSPDTFDWTLLDAEADRAVAAGKRLSIGILAASNSPRWLADEGAATAQFSIEKSETRPCAAITLPLPWDKTYMRALVRVHREMKRHLQSKPGAYEALSIIKLSGIAQHNLELRLPRSDGRPRYQKDGSLAPCQPDDHVSIWQSAGYTPKKVLRAWRAVAKNIARIFPDALIAQAIQEAESFPAIGEDGQRIPRREVALADDIMWEGIESPRFGTRFAVQYSSLRLDDDEAFDRIAEAHAAGAAVAWQTNLLGSGGAGCQKDRHSALIPCTAELYAALLNRGFDEGGTYLEIWQADALKFRTEIGAAKGRL